MAGKAKGKNQKMPNETSHFRVENQHAYILLLQACAHECVCVCVCVCVWAQVLEDGQRTHLKALRGLARSGKRTAKSKWLKEKVLGSVGNLSGHREPGSVSQETRIFKNVNKSENDIPSVPNVGKFCVLRDIILEQFTGHLSGPLSSMPSFVRTWNQPSKTRKQERTASRCFLDKS